MRSFQPHQRKHNYVLQAHSYLQPPPFPSRLSGRLSSASDCCSSVQMRHCTAPKVPAPHVTDTEKRCKRPLSCFAVQHLRGLIPNPNLIPKGARSRGDRGAGFAPFQHRQEDPAGFSGFFYIIRSFCLQPRCRERRCEGRASAAQIRRHCSPGGKDVRTAGVLRWTRVFVSSELFVNPLMFLISRHCEQALLIMLVMRAPVMLKRKSYTPPI